MPPKKAPDEIVAHRIELQEKEREILDALVMSNAVRNVGAGVGSVINPFLTMTPAGALALASFVSFILTTTIESYQKKSSEAGGMATPNLWQQIVWNMTIPGVYQDVKEGDFWEERLAYGLEMASRIKSWGESVGGE
jgi:hypothetical protein